MTHYWRSIYAAALVTVSCASNTGATRAPTPHLEPRWDGGGLLAGISGAAPATPAAFATALSARWEHALRLEVKTRGGVEDATIANCEALLRIPWSTVWDSKDEPFGTIRAWYVSCGAIVRMPRAATSIRSFMSFTLTALLADLASTRILVGPHDDEKFFEALKRRTEERCITERRCLVRTPTDRYAIELLAIADFNGDGVEDVMGEVSAGPEAGTAVYSRGFIVTRRSAHGPLRVVEWW